MKRKAIADTDARDNTILFFSIATDIESDKALFFSSSQITFVNRIMLLSDISILYI